MKVLNFLMAICLVCFLASCGDSTCDVADWTGTWTLDADSVSECDDADDFTTSFVITAGTEAGTVLIDGTEATLNDESCMFIFDEANVELDGDQIRVDLDGCMAVYR